jgi:hypothetical protein
LGADIEEESSESSEEEEEDSDESEEDEEQVQEKEKEGDESEEEEEEVEDNPPAARQKKRGMEEYQFEVGDFVTAVYEGQWLLAQVDIDQDKAGTSHVNLTYMERVGRNQFRWPKQDDRLLTLKEDILTTGVTPTLVGSTIRASNVGLSLSELSAAEAALQMVVYLELFGQFSNFFLNF